VAEKNGYAISVPRSKQSAAPSIAHKGVGYGVPGIRVDGNDVLALRSVLSEAIERARRGDGPTLIEMRCVRLTAHSSDDNDRTYRTKEEKEADRKVDPIAFFQHYLLEHGILTEAADEEVRRRIEAEVNDATDYAEQAPAPVAEDLLKHVYATEEEVAEWRSKL